MFTFYLLSFAAAIVTGLVFRHVFPSREAFVLELPPYRAPSLGTILRRAWMAMLNFLVTTRVFIVGGGATIWLLTHLPPGAVQRSGRTLADGIGGLFQPLLGAMAVIYRNSTTGLGPAVRGAIKPLQALSFMAFVLL